MKIINRTLELEIYSLDPIFFEEVNFDKTVSGMCWGIECEDDRYETIKAMVQEIRKLNDEAIAQNEIYFVAKQIKEKFGKLRVYWRAKRHGVELDINEDITSDEVIWVNRMEEIINEFSR